MAAFEYRQALEIRDACVRHNVKYLFIGKSGAILLKNGPFDLDLIFAPDGIEKFEDAWNRRVDVEGFPVCDIDDIVSSKRAANRQKDKESLPRLISFGNWLKKR